MSRYIDADEFLTDESEAYVRAQAQIEDEETRLLNMIVHRKVQMLIGDAPTADVVEVKHGKWERHGMDIAEHPLRCSVCSWGNHHIADRYVMEMDYCPCCGARMDGES